MAKIPDHIKAFIVMRWAMFDTPAQVVEAVREEYDFALDVLQAKGYRGDRSTGSKMAEKWKILFAETRQKYIDELTTHPVAHKSFRIAQLGKIVDEAMKAKNYKLAQSAMEQAAKETGGAYTNEVNVKGKVEHSGRVKMEEASPEERRNYVSDKLMDALEAHRHRTQH